MVLRSAVGAGGLALAGGALWRSSFRAYLVHPADASAPTTWPSPSSGSPPIGCRRGADYAARRAAQALAGARPDRGRSGRRAAMLARARGRERLHTPGDRPRRARAVELRGLRPVGVTTRASEWSARGAALVSRREHGAPFAGDEYAYLYHRHKFTWLTDAPSRYRSPRRSSSAIAGRGSSRWATSFRTIGPSTTRRDKYERAPGVVNRDVLDLAGLGEFDLVLAVSTLEHVGRDEEPRDPIGRAGGPRSACAARAGRPAGKTVPVGYHLGLDAALRTATWVPWACAPCRRERLGPHWCEVPVHSTWRFDDFSSTPPELSSWRSRPCQIASAARRDGPFPYLVRPRG